MMWTVERVRDEFGEDVLRDITRDVNDLICGMAGHGHNPNRIGIPEGIWRSLLAFGGYTASGVEKVLKGEPLVQEDTEHAFSPYTIHSLVNITDTNGGPVTAGELDRVLTCALTYRQLIQPA